MQHSYANFFQKNNATFAQRVLAKTLEHLNCIVNNFEYKTVLLSVQGSSIFGHKMVLFPLKRETYSAVKYQEFKDNKRCKDYNKVQAFNVIFAYILHK